MPLSAVTYISALLISFAGIICTKKKKKKKEEEEEIM